MKLTELFLEQLDGEAPRSARALAEVPEGKEDWKPHDKSMAFGYLCQIVATIPSWVAMIINQDELDIAPVGGPTYTPRQMKTAADLTAGLEHAVAEARAALRDTTDDYLTSTRWKLLAAGNLAAELPRHVFVRDVFGHSAHHRGQLTVYLRLLGAKVPALYGPSADDRSFG